jgi:hypothetical protein
MAIRIQFDAVELARVRFAVSPVYETVMALDALHQPGVHAVHLPWVRWARPRLRGVPGLDLLRALVAERLKPAFLVPAPDVRMPDFAGELRRIRRTTAEQVRDGMADFPRRAAVVREFLAEPRPGPSLGPVADALEACYELVIAPYWPRIAPLLDADIVHRTALLAEGGVERLFADLHAEVTWTGDELLLYPRRQPSRPVTVPLTGRGIVLCPSVFAWPRVTASLRPVAAGTLRYPARGVATLWERSQATPDALAALLGATRAAMLVSLARPSTTADLARQLGVTPGAISQHLGVLRAAGLVTTHRDGRSVLHLRTPRGDTLHG